MSKCDCPSLNQQLTHSGGKCRQREGVGRRRRAARGSIRAKPVRGLRARGKVIIAESGSTD